MTEHCSHKNRWLGIRERLPCQNFEIDSGCGRSKFIDKNQEEHHERCKKAQKLDPNLSDLSSLLFLGIKESQGTW